MKAMKIFDLKSREAEDHWMSVSDIMAGLMMVFLFIAVVFMMNIQNVTANYKDKKDRLNELLKEEFKEDLPKWNAELDKLTIRFFGPKVLFHSGEYKLTPKFKRILRSFIPRLLNIIHSNEFHGYIEELRIEGHTSSEWQRKTLPENERYLKNLNLSQLRAFNTSRYILGLPGLDNNDHRSWLRSNVAAIGFSSARLIKNQNNKENKIN